MVTSLFLDDAEPQVYVWMAPSFKAAHEHPDLLHFLRFDARNGALLSTSQTEFARGPRPMDILYRVHTDLFLGFPGALFMASIGLMLVIATISGVVLFGPLTKRMSFGTIRDHGAPHIRWLDTPNLLGIVMVAWLMVVRATAIMNKLAAPLFDHWQRTGLLEVTHRLQAPTRALDQSAISVERIVRLAEGDNVCVSVAKPHLIQ